MTTLVTGDPHFSASPRDAYRWRFLEETLPALITEHNVSRLIILGDLTEAKDGHPAALVNRLVDGLAAIAAAAPIYVLRGNHDYRAEDVPFFRFLGHIPRVRWINAPTRLKLRGLGDCMFLPHSAHPVEEWTAAGVPTMRADWFFCHATFEGTKTETGHRLSGVPRSIFPRGARVVSGDIHHPHNWYVGAPYRVDAGDDYEPRVFVLDGKGKRSVPVPGPQKLRLTLSGRDPLGALAMRHPLAGVLPGPQAGDVVKVRVELPEGSELSRAEVRAQVRAWADAAGVQLFATEIIAPKASSAVSSSRAQHRASDADLVRAYAKKMGKGKTTVAAGLKIVEETT